MSRARKLGLANNQLTSLEMLKDNGLEIGGVDDEV